MQHCRRARAAAQIPTTELITIGFRSTLDADDMMKLVSTFPTVRDVFVCDCKLTGEQFRLLGKLPRLEKLSLVRSPADEGDLRWLKSQHPEMQLELVLPSMIPMRSSLGS